MQAYLKPLELSCFLWLQTSSNSYRKKHEKAAAWLINNSCLEHFGITFCARTLEVICFFPPGICWSALSLPVWSFPKPVMIPAQLCLFLPIWPEISWSQSFWNAFHFPDSPMSLFAPWLPIILHRTELSTHHTSLSLTTLFFHSWGKPFSLPPSPKKGEKPRSGMMTESAAAVKEGIDFNEGKEHTWGKALP